MAKDKKKTKIFGFFSKILLIVVLIAACVASFLYFYQKRKNRSFAIMEDKIEAMGELTTIRQVYRNVIYTETSHLFNIVNKRLLFAVDYHIEAGVNLREAELSLLPSGEIMIVLPKPEIFSIDAKETSIEQIFSKEQLAVNRQSDYMPAIIEEKENMEKYALESSLLQKASDKAEDILTRLFRLSGFEDVSFSYKSVNQDAETELNSEDN